MQPASQFGFRIEGSRPWLFFQLSGFRFVKVLQFFNQLLDLGPIFFRVGDPKGIEKVVEPLSAGMGLREVFSPSIPDLGGQSRCHQKIFLVKIIKVRYKCQ